MLTLFHALNGGVRINRMLQKDDFHMYICSNFQKQKVWNTWGNNITSTLDMNVYNQKPLAYINVFFEAKFYLDTPENQLKILTKIEGAIRR